MAAWRGAPGALTFLPPKIVCAKLPTMGKSQNRRHNQPSGFAEPENSRREAKRLSSFGTELCDGAYSKPSAATTTIWPPF